MRDGSTTVSWYHSPLLPQPQEFNFEEKYYTLSDQLLQYDPDTGMFDITYSAAWELGRMLALKDTKFSQSLLQWRIENKGKAIEQMNMEKITEQAQLYTFDKPKEKPKPDESPIMTSLEELLVDIVETVWDLIFKVFGGHSDAGFMSGDKEE